jgi:type I restriction enzyme M protein
MTASSSTIVQRLWNYCNVLRDDGMSYGDYVEQLTYLLFLKMADEGERLLGKASAIPAGLGWPSLRARDGDDLETHYRHILTELGTGAARPRSRSRIRPSCAAWSSSSTARPGPASTST